MIEMFFEVLPITILVAVIYSVYRYIKIKKNNLTCEFSAEIIKLIFVCYLTGLINLVLVPSNFWSNIWYCVRTGHLAGNTFDWFSGGINYVPTIYKWLIGELTIGSWVKDMLIGNIMMFIPMGILLPLVFKKINNKNIKKFFYIIPIIIEVIQPIIGRSFDIDDLIMNFIGILIGYFIVSIFRGVKNKL